MKQERNWHGYLQPVHGMSGSRTYNAWLQMRARCRNPNHPVYSRYGGRGIHVCERWESFQNFLDDMGTAPDGMELDRIDNNGPYSPENCRWADRHAQMNNMGRNRRFSFRGTTATIAEWARAAGTPYDTMAYRLRTWPTERALDDQYIVTKQAFRDYLRIGLERK